MKEDFKYLMELSRGYWRSSIFFTGVKLGIFDHLEGNGMRLDAIVKSLDIDRRGAQILLNALAALRLIEKDGENYRNTQLASRYLLQASPDYKGNIFMHSENMWKAWGELENAVRTGKPFESYEEKFLRDEKRRVKNFILGMDEIAGEVAEALSESREVMEATKMLDVGGGPGTYCRYFIRKNPRLKATILDLPLTIEVTRKLLRKHGLEGKISTIEGDLLEVDFGSSYDLILLSQLLHSFSPKQNAAIIEKAYGALAPGGAIMINDFAVNEDRISPRDAALFAVNMLVNTEGGATYTIREIEGWLSKAGFKRISTRRLLERVTNFTAYRE